MLSPSKVKREIFSSDDDGNSENEENKEDAQQNDVDEDDKIELLEFERNIMLDTLTDDVLFILARGLGLERLMLHHLSLYSDPKLLVFVINTTQHDEAYFLSKLQNTKLKCVPKVINADVSMKDRETLYMEGGVHFITSRILMVDLLQERVPVKNLAGILVYRAHQLLSNFQESFILRLYREKKSDGFVKAFTDYPTALNSIGCLQRLVNRLYVRRVRLVPRFDVDVKRILDIYPPKLIEVNCELPYPMRKVQSSLVDIIRTCLKELKQCSSRTEGSGNDDDDDITNPSSALTVSMLEVQLKMEQFSATDKQQRLATDLKHLRSLLHYAEEHDPATLYHALVMLRTDKQEVMRNSGWLFTPTSSKMFIEAEKMCKVKKDNQFTLLEPPKWTALENVLQEIRNNGKNSQQSSTSSSSCTNSSSSISKGKTPILVLTESYEVSRQLRDLIKWGRKKFAWVQRCQIAEDLPSAKGAAKEPQSAPLWDPTQITLFVSTQEGGGRAEIVGDVQAVQKVAARQGRKRRKQLEEDLKKKRRKEHTEGQTRLVQFGLIHYRKQAKINDKDGSSTDKESSRNTESKEGKKDTGDGSDVDNSEEGEGNVKNEMENNTVEEDEEEEEDPLLVIMAADRRYNLMRHLDALSPEIIIMLHADLTALRLIEMYKACKPEREVRIYVIMYGQSNEEERYLCSLRREQLAFEELIRQQGTLLVSREYNTAREPPPRLKVIKSGRDSRKTNDETVEEKPKIIVDMREFNSELPTVVYKRGTDVIAATLEVADYVLSPQIAVERKSLDDLAQSLCNGRVFKQIDQMLRHYRNVILLVEANMKDGKKRGNVGPFQGELSKRSREIRFLFTVLLWSYPKMHIVWTINPTQSAEMFEEFKLNQPNPDVDHAVSIRGDEDERVDLQTDQPGDQGEAAASESAQQQSSSTSSTTKPTEHQLNRALQRQLMKLPKMTQGDIKRMMLNTEEAKCLLDVINADSERITSVVGNAVLAESLYSFFNMDFRTSKEQE